MKTLVPALLVTGILAACSTKPSDAPSCEGVELVVAASDYSSSVVCGAPGCAIGDKTSGADLGKDPQLSKSRGRLFFLARDVDLLFELDPTCGTPRAKIGVHELAPAGRGAANPHDVAAAPDGSLFVALYNTPQIAVVKDGVLERSIDLSSYDADGNPQAESIRVVDVGGVPKAFVALERLDDKDRLLSKQPSQMLRIDVATRAAEAVVDLEGRNPFNPMNESQGVLFLAEPGNFDASDEPLAGIERFDTATSTTRLLVREKDLGASVVEIAVAEGCGAAIVAGPAPNVNPTSLVTFDPVSGRVLTTASLPVLGPTPGYDLQGLAWRDGELYVGDRRAVAPGYRVHVLARTDTCTLHESRTIDLPQRPVALRAAGK